jgi:hypothetical protein
MGWKTTGTVTPAPWTVTDPEAGSAVNPVGARTTKA